MSDLEQNKAVVRRFFDLLSAGDADGLMAIYADTFFCWTAGSLPFSGTHPRDEAKAMIRGVAAVFPTGWRFTVRTLTAEEDRVAAEAECSGVHVSGKRYEQRYHFLFRIRNGNIHELREYFDTMHANDVLCSAPAPGFSS
jgi:ketosteroid isomerase-like protein